MSEVTVASLAKVLGMPVEKLLEQLAGAGMDFSGPDQAVSSTEKMKLLGFLRRTHGKDEKPAEEPPRPSRSRSSAARSKRSPSAPARPRPRSTSRCARSAPTSSATRSKRPPVTTEREEVLRKLAESKARRNAD